MLCNVSCMDGTYMGHRHFKIQALIVSIFFWSVHSIEVISGLKTKNLWSQNVVHPHVESVIECLQRHFPDLTESAEPKLLSDSYSNLTSPQLTSPTLPSNSYSNLTDTHLTQPNVCTASVRRRDHH